ncbi:MarR family transcriptional regulator [Oceaniradius stylonematis]|uniref:MarR family transcriptional regulator n=1 Tax=Oceaniradius stylonematis TaxID=2184161 RepID=A0A3A8ABY2_9HYPH|nr:MarR family transcriptional regulator [Oceaniradius stylonematis]RKF06499.1 MarR family transcriptional regulator [Oceaniradius stylonematis]
MTDQPDFDIRSFLPYLLNQAAEESSLAFQHHYKQRYGMLRTEWRVLFHLGRYGAMTANAIGTRAKMHKTKISRAVAALEQKRYLTRQKVESDRRHEKLTLTAAGRKVYADLCAVAGTYDAQLLAPFSAEEQALLKRALERLAKL